MNRAAVILAALALAACGAPPGPPPTVTQTVTVVEHDAVGNVASTLDYIRKHSDVAANYTDSQLITIADGICRDGEANTVDAWFRAGHDADLLATIANGVAANPFYCEQQMDPWGAGS